MLLVVAPAGEWAWGYTVQVCRWAMAPRGLETFHPRGSWTQMSPEDASPRTARFFPSRALALCRRRRSLPLAGVQAVRPIPAVNTALH